MALAVFFSVSVLILLSPQTSTIITVVRPPRTRKPMRQGRNIRIDRGVGIIEVGITWSCYQYMYLRKALEQVHTVPDVAFIQMDNSWSDKMKSDLKKGDCHFSYWENLKFLVLWLSAILAFEFYTVVINSELLNWSPFII